MTIIFERFWGKRHLTAFLFLSVSPPCIDRFLKNLLIKAALADRKKVVKTGSISMGRGRCMGRGSAGASCRGMGRGSARVRLRGMGRSSVGAKSKGMGKDSKGASLRGMGRGSAGVRFYGAWARAVLGQG